MRINCEWGGSVTRLDLIIMRWPYPVFAREVYRKDCRAKCGIMRKLSRPPLPFLLFSLLCCTGFLMKHKQKMFSVWEVVHNAHNAHDCVCF